MKKVKVTGPDIKSKITGYAKKKKRQKNMTHNESNQTKLTENFQRC